MMDLAFINMYFRWKSFSLGTGINFQLLADDYECGITLECWKGCVINFRCFKYQLQLILFHYYFDVEVKYPTIEFPYKVK